MKIMKRWLALMLTIPMALSDCGSITAFATEAAIEAETPALADSEEGAQAGEDEDMNLSSEDASVSENDSETQPSELSQLPALHIGQIKEGEELPYTDDSEFIYDLPIIFDMSDSVTLFVNYSMDGMLEKEEQGTLVWSILRAENGTQKGSASLIGEEDDWIGFETVSDSPYFTMTENEEDGGFYKTVKLDAIVAEADTTVGTGIDAADVTDAPDSEDYSYYIRAAYYTGAGKETGEGFYAAATVPFLPGEDADDKAQDDTLDGQEPDEGVTDDASAAEDTAKDEMKDNEPVLEESDIDNESEDTETVAADETGDESSEGGGDSSEGSEGSDAGQETDKKITGLTLDKKKVTMHANESQTVTATIEPEGIPAEISWKSSNESVATVISDGVITAGGIVTAQVLAHGIGTAQITAECDGITAAIKVDVVEEMHDLYKDIKIDGFKRESDDLVYTGDKITQNIRVYHKNSSLNEYVQLTEKVDYTLSYKNNVNAAAYNSAKAPSVTINFRGQYSGSVALYYTIKPLDIKDVNIYNTNAGNTNNDNTDGDNAGKDPAGYEQAVTYSKNLKIPAPELTFGKKKLTSGRDFVCDYTTLPADYKKGDSYEPGKVYNYTVNGTGNFTGSFQMNLVVLKDKNFNFNSAAVTLGKKQYEYKGTALSKSDVTIEKLAFGKTVLNKNLYDYEVCADGIDGSYVMAYPTEAGKTAGYHGSKRVNLKLAGDREIKNAVSGTAWKDSITFSQKTVDEEGGIFQEEENILAFGSGAAKETLIQGKDYAIKYGNTRKAGKVTVTFTGKGRYKGTLKKTYEIKPNSDKNSLTVKWKNLKQASEPLEIAYQKGGAVPEFDLMDSDNKVLKNKTDYTVKLANNKTPGTEMSLEINGRGNYKGYKNTVQIKVTNGDISKGIMLVPDMPQSTKPDAWKSTKITIKDVNGKKLTAGTDYSKEINYNPADGQTTPAAGSVINVTVQGAGAYAGSSIKGSYKIYDKSKDISKLKIIIDPQEYTGEEITLSELDDIHVYATSADVKKKNELYNVVEIVEYMNNIKSGTAKVTLRGRIGSEYGGMRTCSFKIKKKSYGMNRVKGITLSPTKLSMSFQDNEEKRTLTAKLVPEMPYETIWNSTVIWSTSNSSIATVETQIIDATTIKGVIIPKKEGTVTITATAQDGNKKAQCTVTIVDAPVLKESGQTIEGKAGDTHQLEFEGPVNISNVQFESSNSEMVTVDKNGLITMKKVGAALIKVYTNNRKFVQQCFVIVKGDEEEKLPEGRSLIYNQKPGTTDDTQGINQLLQNWEYNSGLCDYVYIPAGVYRIDAVDGGIGIGGIILRDNQTLIMSPSALIMAIGNKAANYQVIYAFGRDNVTISGGQIIGERDEHQGSGGEWGHGISIQGCTNVHISNMDISKCWGDGICLGEYDTKKDGKLVHVPSNYITIENCVLHHNRRNNLSITDANNVTVDNCQFNYAKGTDPQYGICVEYNYTPTEHVKILNSTFKGNAKASMGIIKKATDVRLENCTLDGNFYNMAGINVVLKNTTVGGETVDKTGIKYEK